MSRMRPGGISARKALLAAAGCAAAIAIAPPIGFASNPVDRTSAPCEECAGARQGLNTLMNGHPDEAIKAFKIIESQYPDSPLGYLLDADATWWKIYLTTANLVDPDVFDVLRSSSSPYDSHFHDLISVAIKKARQRIHNHQDVARNELYEGLAYALRARFYGLRDSDFATARAAKKMRSLLLSAKEGDPSLADADAGLGLYNYFVDTLPTIIKLLKFLIGLPPGERQLGLSQQQNAADHGDLVRAEAKFYLAKDYSRNGEMQYDKSLRLFQELAHEYPRNPLWKLLIGTLQVRQGQTREGEEIYREVLRQTANERGEVPQALHGAAQEALDRLHGN